MSISCQSVPIKEPVIFAARQEEATVKRIKLEYDEIGSCVREVMEVWDLLVSKESRLTTPCDSKMLLQAIRQGETCDAYLTWYFTS
jgi:TBC1 domain-containing protein 4